MRLIRPLLVVLLSIIAVFATADAVYSYRMQRPKTFTFPLKEQDVQDLNSILEEIFFMQQGRYELDTVTTSKTNAKNGEMWIENDAGIYEVYYKSGEGVRQLVSSPAYEDLRVGGLGVRLAGAKDPVLTNFEGGTKLYLFDNAVLASEKEVFATFQMSHQWEEGTTVNPHIHFTKQDAGTGNVKWCWEYSMANVMGSFSAATTICGVCAVPSSTFIQDVCSVGNINMSGYKISTTMAVRVYRNSSDASDTYTGDVYLNEMDIHFKADTLGSRQEYIK